MRRPASPRSVERSALVRIDQVGADGDGVGVLDGAPVYVPFSLPGEAVRARLNGRRGVLDAILEASADRALPPCPHFGICGGCALQHWGDAEYVRWKLDQLEGALRRAGFGELPDPSVARTPPNARRRMDLALRREGGRAAVGLHRMRSPQILDLETCLVLHPALFGLVAPLRALLPSLSLLRREGSAIANLLDTGPDLLLRTDAEPSTFDRAALADFARARNLARIHWAKGDDAPEPVCILRPASAAVGGVPVTLPPGAFMQASAEGERAITAAVRAGLPPVRGPRLRVVELFAGCGAISFAVASQARVTAYEADVAAVAALRHAANQAGLAGQVEAMRRDLVRQPVSATELTGADAVILDPPHAGAAAQMPAIAAAQPERVIYVSCNPATLARDTSVLLHAGYRVLAVTLVDQFLWSARIESVSVFARDPPKRRAARSY